VGKLENKLKYAEEEYSQELFKEMFPLCKEHHKEFSHDKSLKLFIDSTKYIALQANNSLKIFTIRTDNRRLVGYCLMFVFESMHYAHTVMATADCFFIKKGFRGKNLIMSFLSWCDQKLKKAGVNKVLHGVKATHDFGFLLKKIGYDKIDVVYGKRLD
jgi:hypothetical protein